MSIHIEFMKNAVSKTVQNLKTEYLDAYRKRRVLIAQNKSCIANHALGSSDGVTAFDAAKRADSKDDQTSTRPRRLSITPLSSQSTSASSKEIRRMSISSRSDIPVQPSAAVPAPVEAADNGPHDEIVFLENYILDVREEEGIVHGKKRRYHRVFVHCHDSGEYAHVGWVLTDEIEFCMSCMKEFTGFFYHAKHHCRACGNVICDVCSEQTEIVDLIEALGPQRVCMQCCYGQSPVNATINIILGNTVITNVDPNIQREEDELRQHISKLSENQEEEIEFSIWHFGDVKLGGIKPGFVLQVRRADESHSKIYINVCSSELIPMSQTENNGHLIYYMVIGEKERGMNGLEVYDVGISEKLMLKLKREPGIKGKVTEQVLSSVAMFCGESTFSSYMYHEKFKSNYLEHATASSAAALFPTVTASTTDRRRSISHSGSNTDLAGIVKLATMVGNSSSSQNATGLEAVPVTWNTAIGEVGVLAIPSYAAFRALHQICTRRSDVNPPAVMPSLEEKKVLQQKLFGLSDNRIRRIASRASKFEFRDDDVASNSSSEQVASSLAATSISPMSSSTGLKEPQSPQTESAPTRPPLSAPVPLSHDRSMQATIARKQAQAQNPAKAGKTSPSVPSFPTEVQTPQPTRGVAALLNSSRSPSPAPSTGSVEKEEKKDERRPDPEQTFTALIIPKPGYVVKTRSLFNNDDEPTGRGSFAGRESLSLRESVFGDRKAFVNVCQSEVIDQLVNDNHFLIPNNDIFVAFGEKDVVTDKEGTPSILYHVVVGSTYFHENQTLPDSDLLRIASDEFVTLILKKINEFYGDHLDTLNFILPRIKGGYKGEVPQSSLPFSYKWSASFHYVPPALTGTTTNGKGNEKRRRSVVQSVMNNLHIAAKHDDHADKVLSPPLKETGRGRSTSDDGDTVDGSSIGGSTLVGREKLVRTRAKVRASILGGLGLVDLHEGEKMLEPNMMEIRALQQITKEASDQIKHDSIEDAQALIGYQITLYEENGDITTYITTGTRRLAVGKTEFRLSRIGHEDRWVHLKRADYKTGFAFKINRQVRLIPFTPNSGIDLSKRSSAPTQN